MTRVFRLLGLLATAALVLTIYGATKSGDAADVNSGTTLRHVGVILFVVLYVLLAAIHVLCWQRVNTLMKHRRSVCISLSNNLPPFLWMFYSCLLASRALCHSSGSVCYTPYSLPFPARWFPPPHPRQVPTHFPNLTLQPVTGGLTSSWDSSWSTPSSSSTLQSAPRYPCRMTTLILPLLWSSMV